MVKCPDDYFHHHDHDHDHDDQELGKIDQSIISCMIINEESKSIRSVKSKLLCLLLLSFICFCCSLFWVSQIFGSTFTLSHLLFYDEANRVETVGSRMNLGTMYCDKSHFRTDVCFMKGDIRTQSSSSSIFLYNSLNPNTSLNLYPNITEESNMEQELQHEIIKPYTRKWETSIMDKIYPLHLISKHKPLNSHHKCDVLHDVPAIFFSAGGYTGNAYHEFNDGIIPLYITSHHFNQKIIFVIIQYHDWWYTKYEKILSQLSNYPPINFKSDPRTHCFREVIVGLKIHNELTIDPSLMQGNESMVDFHNLLNHAFDPLSHSLSSSKKPKLVILSRKGTRSITNEKTLVKLAKKVGFNVQVLNPNRKTELGEIYKTISTSDVMLGVHGAAMTHLLFLRPGSLLIQIIPLGTEWASKTYYGEPAKKFGLKYMEYKIHPRESSLHNKYDNNDPIIRDPNSINKKGWEYTKKIYLSDQKVTLDIKRFRNLLVRVYRDCIVNSKKKSTNS